MTDLEKSAERFIACVKHGGLSVATAESCTAGGLVEALANVRDAGSVVDGGIVAYTKAAKASLLGIDKAMLQSQTAVSHDVAEAMVLGALARSPADIVMAITGVAGPAPDEDGNPIGLVYVAAGMRDQDVKVAELNLGGTPEKIRVAAMMAALALAEELVSVPEANRHAT